jgi:hypothetical protein
VTRARERRRAERARRRAPEQPRRAPRLRPTLIDVAVVLGAFALATGVAALLGAANFGTALTFGQLGFAAALVYVLLRR